MALRLLSDRRLSKLSVDVFAMVGEAVYSQGRAGQTKVGRTNDGQTRDVVFSF